MTSFHTDEYIHFLSRVTPDTAEELTYNGTRCELYVNNGWSTLPTSSFKFLLGMTIQLSMACLNFAPSPRAVP